MASSNFTVHSEDDLSQEVSSVLPSLQSGVTATPPQGISGFVPPPRENISAHIQPVSTSHVRQLHFKTQQNRSELDAAATFLAPSSSPVQGNQHGLDPAVIKFLAEHYDDRVCPFDTCTFSGIPSAVRRHVLGKHYGIPQKWHADYSKPKLQHFVAVERVQPLDGSEAETVATADGVLQATVIDFLVQYYGQRACPYDDCSVSGAPYAIRKHLLASHFKIPWLLHSKYMEACR